MMSWISAVRSRLGLLWRRAADARMDEEFRLHLELETEKNVRAGMDPAEARRRAERSFGDVRRHRESMRLGRGTAFLDRLAADARYAVRGFRRSPAFSAVAVLMLALGIGATTTIFSAAKTILVSPLPYEDADRLVVVYAQRAAEGEDGINVSYVDYQDWKTRLDSFERMGLFNWWSATLAGGDEAERLTGAELTADLIPTLGIEPLLGRNFLPEEEVPGRDRVVLLGHDLWERRFGGDPAIVGRTVEVDGRQSTVVGVMPPDFRFPYSGDLWKPLAPQDFYHERGNRFIAGAIGRLDDGIGFAAAETEMAELSRALERADPNANQGWSGQLVRLRDDTFGPLEPAILLLFGGVALLLFTICGNLAGLLLARGASRRRTLAVRAAIGAGRGRLVRQLLTESLILALAGGALGVAASLWGIGALRGILSGQVPSFVTVRADPWVFGFAFAVTAAVTLVFGLLPAIRGSRVDPGAELKEGGRGSMGGGTRLRAGIVATQVGLAVALLVGSGLLIQSMRTMADIDLGFDARRTLTARYFLPETDYDSIGRTTFARELLRVVRARPGVAVAGAAQGTPFSGWNVGTSYEVEGGAPPAPGEFRITHFQYVTPGFFEALDVPIVRGRPFGDADDSDGPRTVIVNESFVRRHFEGEDPIGRRIRYAPEGEWHEIVGVVADFRHYEVTEPMRPATYLPYHASRNPPQQMTLAVRADGDPAALVPSLRAAVSELDPGVPLYRVSTMREVVEDRSWVQRIVRDLFTAFGVGAALLAVIGLYGVISYTVLQRRKEIGLRLALGATPARVGRGVVREGLVLGAIGVALGTALALVGSRWLSTLLFEVTPTDAVTFVFVGVVVLGLVALASQVPARRAARMDPLAVLRSD